MRELERRRDYNLVAILHALRSEDDGAGRLLRLHEDRLRSAAGPKRLDVDESAPLRLHRAVVPAQWVDYNGHMTEFRYLEVLADATDAFLAHVGLDESYLSGGYGAFTVETHIRHIAEARKGETLSVETVVLDADEKRIHLFHTVLGPADEIVATGEHLLLHVDTGARRSSAMVEPLASRVAAIAQLHAALPRSAAVGRHVGQLRS